MACMLALLVLLKPPIGLKEHLMLTLLEPGTLQTIVSSYLVSPGALGWAGCF